MRLVLVAGLIPLLAACQSEAGKQAALESALIEAAKSSVTMQLRDPASAVFSQVTTSDGKVCGYVNAKNGFGGYAGGRRFVALQRMPAQLEPTASVTGRPPEMVERAELCFFDQYYRACKGETLASDPGEACLPGFQPMPSQLAEPEWTR